MTIIEEAEKWLKEETEFSEKEYPRGALYFARYLDTKYSLVPKEAPKSTECKHDGMFKECPLCQLDNLTGDMRKVIKHINE